MSSTRGIPSLDGLRAISVALVITAHLFGPMHLFRDFRGSEMTLLGQHGVDVFFVISGFLITYLLLKELDAAGDISLKRFYLRRFFRIFPAFYAFLGVLGLLWIAKLLPISGNNYLYAATYTYNYCRQTGYWLLGHCWSLSLEEQFYLLWPPCLLLLGRKRSLYLAIAIIVFSPASRFISYFLLPAFRESEGIMLHTRLDTIMFGCLLALLYDHREFNRVVERWVRPSLVACCAFFFLVVSPFAEAQFKARYAWTLGYSLRAVCASVILIYVVRNPASFSGRFLNMAVMRHIGVISYGLYLWQQLFTGPRAFWFPLNLVLVLACAEVSFLLIERPAFRLRDSIEKRLRAAPKLKVSVKMAG